MADRYSYSLNGELYRGSFASREEALAEAMEAAQRSSDGPQTVYVGRRVPADPKSGGHARGVLANMAARAREEFGDAASDYLTGLTKHQIENLDEALELVVLGWLQRNERTPAFFKVEAIGEYSVPNSTADRCAEDDREVHEIGCGESEGF
jgi:predicted RNase H-like HicB family nuclease